MPNTPKNGAAFKITALDDGNVEIVLDDENSSRVVVLKLSPDQIGVLVAHLLRASRAAFEKSHRIIQPGLLQGKLENPILPNDLQIGITNVENQRVMVFRIGESTIGFTVSNEALRKLGRDLISVAWKQRSKAPLGLLLKQLSVDFLSDLRAWGDIFKTRTSMDLRRRALSFSSIISGKSFQEFCTVKISSDKAMPRYEVIGRCIYCDAEFYSTYSKKPGVRSHPFGGEHIVPEGIGGTIELPEASCQRCEEATGAIVEGSVLGRTLKALRVHLNLKKSGSGSHPKSLLLQATINGVESQVDIPIEDYPVVFMMVQFMPPDVSNENTASGKAVNGAVAAVLSWDQKKLQQKYDITGFATAVWDNQMFCRMLAKIGHSFAVAELGLSGKFAPLLLDLIVNGNISKMNLIGGPREWEVATQTDNLHELSLGYQRFEGETYLVAKVRLFARHGGPPYYVVVGKSLESSFVRFKRVLFNKIDFRR